MVAVATPQFSHRHNSDGSWDSICHCCLLTIATRREESDLEIIEKTHDCESYFLQRQQEVCGTDTRP